jgi:hypothetical protein
VLENNDQRTIYDQLIGYGNLHILSSHVSLKVLLDRLVFLVEGGQLCHLERLGQSRKEVFIAE